MDLRMDIRGKDVERDNVRTMTINLNKDKIDFEKVKSSVIRKEEVYNPDLNFYFNNVTDF